MLKLRALNRESSSDEDAPAIRREAQEEIALDLYNKALRLQCNKEFDEAEAIIRQLIKENIPQLEAEGGLPKTMSTLKFSCYTNLGSISMKKGEIKDSLENYLLASELDDKDVTLWYKIGKLALKLDKFKQAAYAFYMGLECSESHWPCLDELISLLFALRDTVACLKYIGKALIMDSNYTKGLVLRKSIYDSNIATKEYYQLFNPDYIYEPSLEIDIDETSEIEVLKEAQLLCDRINEIEKSVGPKELTTIPLPKPLEDFTWLSLGKTIIEVHKYITNNNMSHFTMIDLKRCMSTIMEVEELSTVETEIKETVTPTEVIEKKEPVAEADNDLANEKLALVQIERRMSQFSENDTNDPENKTPVQTDNDEVEQDGEEPLDLEEQGENKADKMKNQSRGMKRKRDLVSELQIWGWHSKRKSAKRGKFEKDFTIEDAFKRIIPTHLLPNGIAIRGYNSSEDSMNTMEIYQLHMEEKSLLTPIHSPVPCQEGGILNTKYFGTEAEKLDVQQFWNKKRACCDAVNLVEEYVLELCNMWKHKWPKGLTNVYTQLYVMYREHFDHPQIFCNDIDFETIRKDALITLLYAELVTYNKKRPQTNEKCIHNASISQLEFISGWSEYWKDDYVEFFLRVNWLKTHLCRKDMQNLLSITALQLMQEIIIKEELEKQLAYELLLPNCDKFGKINLEVIEKILKNLEMIDSLSRLEELYDKQQYVEVADIVKATFKSSMHPTSKKITRQAQLGMLLHSLWFTDFSECFLWSEECLYEALDHFLKLKQTDDKWNAIVEKCVLIMYEIIKVETVGIVDCLSEPKRFRLVESLCKICCKQINAENASKLPLASTIPWVILHYVLLREEHRQQAQKKVKKVKKEENDSEKCLEDSSTENGMPPSIEILFSAHEFLGPKGWCLTNQGELLHFIIDTILDRLDTPSLEALRDKIDIHLEQAFFCLYQHPSKKNKVSRHLADHNVNPLPLSWERAQQLFEFFCPDALPEFDSYKSISISSELEQLLQRIIALVPSECDPQPLIPQVTDFVHGNIDTLPKPIHFPLKTRSIYYLLGDYYFKQSDVKRSLKYFLLDLCICPLRLDTWACMALGIASQLEYKLTHCERFKSEMEFLDKAKSAQVCFKEALRLSSDHVTLWIEFGSFEYMVHSFCSRVLKYESDMLSMEKFEILENKKEGYLNSSQSSFMKALDLYQPDQSDADERWLQHYILAKIAEKHQKEPSEYLEHYYKAAKLLEENNASYPERINYNNPQHLSLEALEVFYRINASVLKYLELHEGKDISLALGKTFKRYLDLVTLSKTAAKGSEVKVDTLLTKTKDSKDEQLKIDVQKCVNDIITDVVNNEVKLNDSGKDVIMISDSDDDKQDSLNQTRELEKEEVSDVKQTVIIDFDKEENLVTKNIQAPNSSVVQDHNYTDKEETLKEAVEDSSTSATSSSDSTSSDSDSESTCSSSTSASSDNVLRNLSDSELSNLVDKCIAGLEECIRRLPQNYKALYRLSHMYFHYTKRKDLTKAKQLLLGEYKCKNSAVINGLFSDRKISNFFNGIWRIPSSEIDRPGSLSAHMGRCVNLLLQILRNTNDHKTLLDLCLQLRRIPDADKVYIRHSEREQLSEQALSLCIQTLRNAIRNATTPSAVEKLMIDIFKAYQRSQKSLVHKETVFSNMLVELYKKFMNDKLPENSNTLDLAVKYCQQNRAAEKLKKQQTPVTLQKPPVLNSPPPILPSVSNVNLLPSLKKSHFGRPRGRPPGSTSIRSPRGRLPGPSSSNPFMPNTMFDQNAVMDYLRTYQKELLMQYSQTMSLQQMAQMPHLNPNQMQNTLLLQSMQQMLNSSLLSSNFNMPNVNPNLYKKASEQFNLPSVSLASNSNLELLKLQSIMSQNASASKKATSSTANLKTSSSNSKINVSQMNSVKPPQTTIYSQPSTQLLSNFAIPEPSKFKAPSTTSYHASYLNKIAKEKEHSNLLLKERPNLSITPVNQPTSLMSTSPGKPSASPGKTLQEKLADKQKQNMNKGAARNIDFFTAPNSSISIATKQSPISIAQTSITNLPNFSKESGISISHVPLNAKPIDGSQKKEVSLIKNKPRVISTHTNMPISLSVLKKGEDEKAISDDVIIIE